MKIFPLSFNWLMGNSYSSSSKIIILNAFQAYTTHNQHSINLSWTEGHDKPCQRKQHGWLYSMYMGVSSTINNSPCLNCLILCRRLAFCGITKNSPGKLAILLSMVPWTSVNPTPLVSQINLIGIFFKATKLGKSPLDPDSG